MPVNKVISFLVVSICLCLISYAQSAQIKSNSQIADSLDALSKYKESLKYRSLALKEPGHSKDFEYRNQAKYHYTQACIYEIMGGQENYKKALEHSYKAKSFSDKITSSSIQLRHYITNRIYHQSGYIQDWLNTYKEAKENYRIILDTFPEHHFRPLLILDDLGYINVKLGDYQKAIEYYDKSLDLYSTHFPEKKRDLAMNYGRMADCYKALGLRKKELDALGKAENYWETAGKRFIRDRFSSYEKLSDWYNYYGNYKLAKTYLNKQNRVIDTAVTAYKVTETVEFRRRDYLKFYCNYIDFYLDQNDFENAKKYMTLSKEELKASEHEFAFDVKSELSLYLYESKLPQNTGENAVGLIENAISLARDYEDRFFTDPKIYEIELFKVLIDQAQNTKAEEILKSIIESTNTKDNHHQFYLLTNYGSLLGKRQSKEARTYFENALRPYLLNSNEPIDFSRIKIDDLKPIYAFETIDGVNLMAAYFLEESSTELDNSNINIANNLYVLASDIFARLYLGDRFNQRLFNTYKTIESGLLASLKNNKTQPNIRRTLEAIENNTSKLTWSKFQYSTQEHKLNVPDSITNREIELKTLINFYNNRLFNETFLSENESDTINGRLSDLELELVKLQENIKSNYTNYYNQHNQFFKLEDFANTLSKDECVFRFIISENVLFYFEITDSGVTINSMNLSNSFQTDVVHFVKELSRVNSDYTLLSPDLRTLSDLIHTCDKKDITIIPDGVLHYLPFETLLMSKGNMTDILGEKVLSYGPSLMLLYAQNIMIKASNNVAVGIFAPEFKNEKNLPSINTETKAILDRFNGNVYSNITKEGFLQKAQDYNILHLATHSKIDQDNPDFSSLDFANSQLLMAELYHEAFRANLVVLSACETGSGNFENGEGVQSISRAFTYTGIPSTVMSLWKVDDEATSKIMSAFYEYLSKGKNKDKALKLAKIDYINNVEEAALKHPYYWAGFIINGNTSAVVSSNSKKPWYLLIASFFVLIIIYQNRLKFFKQ